MSFNELHQIEHLARIVGGLDEEPRETRIGLWGPASWWRIGLVALAAFIAILGLWHALS